jgi:hypothetical protein
MAVFLTAQYQLQHLLLAPYTTLCGNCIRPSVLVYLPDIPKIDANEATCTECCRPDAQRSDNLLRQGHALS